MRTKDLAQTALLVAIAIILRTLTPPIFLGMKPDLTLTMMFIIFIIKRDIKLGFLTALTTAIFTALTTTFPGGQIANIVDKLITFLIVYNLISIFNNFFEKRLLAGITTFIGTIISGSIFLTTASLLVELPASFSVLFLSVVLPAAVVNTGAAFILYTVIDFAMNISVKGREENEVL